MIHIDPDLCKGCLLCVNTCHKHVYAVSDMPNKKEVLLPYPANEKNCSNCKECELVCPDQAISVDIERNWWMSKDNTFAFNPNFAKQKHS
ncbi:4Fe-4S dicluster domain-containing protein [Methanobrevibacter sp.]